MNDAISQLDFQKNYNSKKSKRYKTLYYTFEVLIIFFTCLTTFLLTIENISPAIPAIASAMAIMLKSISSFVGFQKQWITCRVTTEKLKSEKRKYLAGIYEYENINQVEKEKVLAKNMEQIVDSMNEVWVQITNNEKEDKK